MVSVIFTVLNEARTISVLLDSLAAQTRQPGEVVVCDGGSTDETLALIHAETNRRRMKVRLLLEPGANIARGRNLAIAAAYGDIIACCDAGVRLEPDWLSQITAPFREDAPPVPGVFAPPPAPNAVAGFFVAEAHSTFETALSATVLPVLSEIRPDTFLPSSRSVAFRKTAWQAADGYPEWLDYCEDLLFDFAVRETSGGFVFAPRAIAHFRPRSTLRAFFKQYYLYARGDGKANLWLKRHVIRYLTYLVAVPALVAGVVLVSPLLLLALAIGAGIYLRQPYHRLPQVPAFESMTLGQKLHAAALIPLIRVTGDIAKMLGYPVGLLWRARQARRG